MFKEKTIYEFVRPIIRAHRNLRRSHHTTIIEREGLLIPVRTLLLPVLAVQIISLAPSVVAACNYPGACPYVLGVVLRSWWHSDRALTMAPPQCIRPLSHTHVVDFPRWNIFLLHRPGNHGFVDSHAASQVSIPGDGTKVSLQLGVHLAASPPL